MEIVLSNHKARVGILPLSGGAMSRYEFMTPSGMRPVLSGPGDVVNFPLIPWQNRISNGGFNFAGRFLAIARNVETSDFPIHGNGWQRAWTIADHNEDTVRLTLGSDGPSEYRYAATLSYQLGADGRLKTGLSATNLGPELPFGLGFHPYFTRTPDVALRAGVSTVTLQDARYMPTETVQISARPEWDFNPGRPLPTGWINNEFSGWDGVAEITWPSWDLGCTILSPGVSRYLVYSPDAAAPFFCFEPVTHSVDAFNRGEIPGNGLVVLKEGETLALRTDFLPHRP